MASQMVARREKHSAIGAHVRPAEIVTSLHVGGEGQAIF